MWGAVVFELITGRAYGHLISPRRDERPGLYWFILLLHGVLAVAVSCAVLKLASRLH